MFAISSFFFFLSLFVIFSLSPTGFFPAKYVLQDGGGSLAGCLSCLEFSDLLSSIAR